MNTLIGKGLAGLLVGGGAGFCYHLLMRVVGSQ